MIAGERLRILRTGKNLKQEDIAMIIHRTPQAYSQYELGKRQPDLESIRTLAEFYSVSSDYIIGLTDDSTPYYNVRPQNLKQLDLSGLSKDRIDTLLTLVRFLRQSQRP
jgi:transcriptional regulator with XRE-family HTH domain